jgi:hypothetical protein
MPSTLTKASLPLSTREGEAAQAQFSVDDYGRVGDQRPYQIVYPSYTAPKFLSRFAYLKDALRECGTLCQTTGQPFRLVKWGSRVPCYPCRARKSVNRLPSLRIHSAGALDGHPSAMPIADFHPGGRNVVYNAQGQAVAVGAPNYVVTRTPNPNAEFYNPRPLSQRYAEAVNSAVYLANATGRNTYLCSSMGGDCNNASMKKLTPIVYVEPGGLVRRYHKDLSIPNSRPGSITGTGVVTEAEFRELLRESEGRSTLPADA